MDYFDSAVQAKRNKEFNLALKYYEMEQKQEGLSVALLMAVAKIYYLKNERETALRFNLAATHLAMHLDYNHLKRGDFALRNALEQIPQNIRRQLPHEIAGMLYFNPNYSKHLSHAVMDSEAVFRSAPQLRPYADIYYASILGDGSDGPTYDKYNLSPKDLMEIEENEYIPTGLDILFKELKWDQIQNPDVYALYF